MSQRSPAIKPFIEDIERTAAQILQFSAGVAETDFSSDVMMQWAVIRGLEVLGEASKQLLDLMPESSIRFPTLPFKKMYATRNRLIHGYATTDMETIWEIVRQQIPAVLAAAQAILADWPSDLA